MKIGLHSRHCQNFNKDVIDFTKKVRIEILQYILSNYDKRICGHIYPNQLDFTKQDILITINTLNEKTKNSNLSFYLLTLSTLLLGSCHNQNDIINSNKSQIETTQKTDTNNIHQKSLNNKVESVIKVNNSINDSDSYDAIDGEIIIRYDSSSEQHEPYTMVTVMPEFVGGIDSLIKYINTNLKYPQWEKENKIEGRLFLSFVIDKNGKIKDSRIIKTIEGSRTLDIEALRVINNMPDWIPGQLHGKNVDVEFNIPILFKQ